MSRLDDKGLSWIRQYLAKSGAGAPAKDSSPNPVGDDAGVAVADAPSNSGDADGAKTDDLIRQNLIGDSYARADSDRPANVQLDEQDEPPSVNLPDADNADPWVIVDIPEKKDKLELKRSHVVTGDRYVDNVANKMTAKPINHTTLEVKTMQFSGQRGNFPVNMSDIKFSLTLKAMKFVMRGGIIYPLNQKGELQYDKMNTPQIVMFADWVLNQINERLKVRREITEAGFQFMIAKAQLAGAYSPNMPVPRPSAPPRVGGRPPTAPPVSGGGAKGGGSGGGGTGAPKGGTSGTTGGGGGGGELPTTPMRLPEPKIPVKPPGKGPSGTIIANPPPPPAKPPANPGAPKPGNTTIVSSPPPMPKNVPPPKVNAPAKMNTPPKGNSNAGTPKTDPAPAQQPGGGPPKKPLGETNVTPPPSKPMGGSPKHPNDGLRDLSKSEIAAENVAVKGYKPPRLPPSPGDGKVIKLDKVLEGKGGPIRLSGSNNYHRTIWQEYLGKKGEPPVTFKYSGKTQVNVDKLTAAQRGKIVQIDKVQNPEAYAPLKGK